MAPIDYLVLPDHTILTLTHTNKDPELVKKIGAATALEVRATGIQYAYAPCIAVCQDLRDKVAACAKHFVGDGGTQNVINENTTIIHRKGLMSIHMPGYFDAIAKGVSTVMVSYSRWNWKKMHANCELLYCI
ncbi:hypothetical protein Taro_037928 [Colocasia esculenta]|uniref:beta-glucosidase n=1 Tax=Colocasia esculenta TaxID=4460 RepID=A0A843W1Z0_COLES|nr:hypothetical protein [Colocasia esculenta]